MMFTGLLAAAASVLLTITSALLPAAAPPSPGPDPTCGWQLAATQLYADLIGRTDDRSVRLRALLAASGVGSASFLPARCTTDTPNSGGGAAGSGNPATPGSAPAGGSGDQGSTGGNAGDPGTPAGGYVFDEEFTGPALDTTRWAVLERSGDPDNNESQCYKPANVTQSGGYLQITSKVDPCPTGQRYSSGAVQWKSATLRFGTIEIRARQSGGQGSWPAQWLLGARCQAGFAGTAANVGGCDWPNPGSDEIDIAEFKSEGATVNWQNVVSGGSGFKTCKPTVSDAAQNWHTYTFTWTASSISWGVDGKTTCTRRDIVPQDPMFLIINNAMGGAGGAVNDADFPQTMLIDYVRVSASPTTPTVADAGSGGASGAAAAGTGTGTGAGAGAGQGTGPGQGDRPAPGGDSGAGTGS